MKTQMPFQPIVKDAYSHGLEEIYQLENVDINTVRKMAIGSDKKLVEDSEIADESESEKTYSLDLGDRWRNWIEPQIFDEPLDVLNLSAFTDKCLRSREIYTLRPLYNARANLKEALKGIGLGHLDEVERKLRSYLKDKPLQRSYFVDYASWLRALFAEKNRVGAHLLLKKYGLESYFPLHFGELSEIKKMTPYALELLVKKLEDELKLEASHLTKAPLKWAEAFLLPFANFKFGLISVSDANYFWQRSSKQAADTMLFHAFISDLFYLGRPVIEEVFEEVQKGFFAVDSSTKKHALALIEKLKSYFFSDGCIYSLKELCKFVKNELCRDWQEACPHEIERIIELSPSFQLLRKNDGELYVMAKPDCQRNPQITFI